MGRWRQPALRYAAALAAVCVAFALTAAIPLLHERFTFFLFWPLIFVASWLGGLGPGLLATAASAVAVILLIPPMFSPRTPEALVPTIVAFVLAGGIGAMLARWRGTAEDALRAGTRRFQLLADSAPVLIWEAASDGARQYFNGPWLRFTGRSLAQERGDGWLESVHPDDAQRYLDAYRAALRARRPFELEYRLRRHDGAYRTVLARGVPRLTPNGELEAYVGICVDVTDHRSALEEARDARDAAESANRAKDAFLATVSHELRTPLSPILTWAHMLREGGLDADQERRALETIERSARSQAQLIDDLLDLSRIAAGKLRLQVRPVELGEVIENAVETVRAAAEAKAIRLQVVLDGAGALVSGDPDRLQQVMWNLLSNAVKFTTKGGRVQVVLERVNSHVEIAVVDTGCGLAAEQIPYLFQRFWQADPSASRTHGGLGLGLAIARHLVELHGGSLVAESPGPGQGSTFTLKLPRLALARTAGEEQRRHPTLRDPAGDTALVRLDGLAVLLVDDEIDACEAARLLLERCGARVRAATSAARALEILEGWRADVLVSDIGMPDQDGYALLAHVRASAGPGARIPAIALTAFASVDDRVRLLSAGFQLHLAKPVDPGELTAAVAAVTAPTRSPPRE